MADDEPAEPTLRDLGEFAVIDTVVAGRGTPAAGDVGPGDDAAVLTAPDGRVVVSTDMLIEGRHFLRRWSTPFQIGRKAIAQNAADIEAMGAQPTGFVVGFGAPSDTSVAAARELSDGMWAEALRCGGAGIVGGDLVASAHWVVSVTALGDLAGRAPVLRSGARPGAVVAVVGVLGWSAAGLALLHAGYDDSPEFAPLRERHLVPEPPYGQGAVAADAGAQAMTDISDGLVADLAHLAKASAVAVELDSAWLAPDCAELAAAARLLGCDARDWVLGGGEDHALVACFDGPPPTGWRQIGTVVAGVGEIRVDGSVYSGAPGWESFDVEADS